MRNYEQVMLNSEAMRNRKNPQRPAANKGYNFLSFNTSIIAGLRMNIDK